ncbi:MAG: helix-turn-helix domain-containing protein [Bacteroides sp.]|nr:helix-turn-helix domain-containing protein [Bacteroides sp.]
MPTVLLILLFMFSGWMVAGAANATPSEKLKVFFKENSRLSSEELFSNGMRCIAESKPDSALAYYSIALARYDSNVTGPDAMTLGSIYNNMGYIYLYSYNDCVQAYSYFLKALETQEKADDKELKPYILLNIGNVYAMFNDQMTAIDTYKKAFASLVLDGSDNDIASIIALNLFLDAYIEHRVAEITGELTQFLNLPVNGEKLQESAKLVAQGIKSEQEGKPGNERATFGKARKMYEQDANADQRICMSLAFMEAESNARSGDTQTSIRILHNILQSSKNEGSLDLASVAAYNLSKCYELQGMADSANFYRLQNLDLRDSLLNMANFGKIKDLHSMHNVSDAQEEIRILVIKDRNKTTVLLFSLVAAALLLILLAVIAAKNKKLKARNESLFQHAQRLSAESQDVKPTALCADESQEDIETPPESQSSKVIVSDDLRDELKEKISQVFKSEEIYSPDFSLDLLASLVNSKTRYVSSVINECFGRGFNQMLSEARITRACRMLADKQYDNLTIQSVAESLGFKSRSNFGALFKKFTGLTPSEYHSIAIKKRETGD